MRFIKLGAISVIVLFLVIYIMSLFIPSHVRISRAIDIALPRDSIVKAIDDMKQWKEWNAFVTSQDLTNKRFEHGAFHADQLTIRVLSASPDSVRTLWQQHGRNIHSGFNLIQQGNRTVVQWYFDFYQQWYPWEKFGSIVFDSQLGPPMEQSMGQLKKLLENSR